MMDVKWRIISGVNNISAEILTLKQFTAIDPINPEPPIHTLCTEGKGVAFSGGHDIYS
jgi:hypothetical protein